MEKIKINNLSVVECKLIKQLNKEDHVVCFKQLCLLGEGVGPVLFDGDNIFLLCFV